MASYDYDLVVIGAGPAGYVAAIRAAQLGMNVCLLEGRSTLGGTCLNVGCIPSKALLHASEKFHEVQHGLFRMGIEAGAPTLNLKNMLGYKDGVVKKLTQGLGGLMKKNKVSVKQGWGQITAPHNVQINEKEKVTAEHILIATGSTPVELPFAPCDHKIICNSTDALAFDRVPKKLVVIGAGVIGLEMGSVWSRLGAEVTLVDIAERPLMVMDEALGKAAQKSFTQQGLKFLFSSKVLSVEATKTGATVKVETPEETQTLKADKVLVAVGRKANTDGVWAADVGIATDDCGVIQVDSHYQTNVAGIYAIGDCTPGPMLAHKGEEEGVACVEHLAGQKPHVNYQTIPWVVYTHPEVAGVGKTEAECKEAGFDYKVGTFQFVANGRALAVDATEGFVKMLADATTDRLLGVHIFGVNASELIAEAALALEFGASSEDLARTCHAHPTMAEAVKEAALSVHGRVIHS